MLTIDCKCYYHDDYDHYGTYVDDDLDDEYDYGHVAGDELYHEDYPEHVTFFHVEEPKKKKDDKPAEKKKKKHHDRKITIVIDSDDEDEKPKEKTEQEKKDDEAKKKEEADKKNDTVMIVHDEYGQHGDHHGHWGLADDGFADHHEFYPEDMHQHHHHGFHHGDYGFHSHLY